MRVAVYDKNPGTGIWQAFLAFTWLAGCFLHKLFGKLDDYYGATSWEEAFKWLETRPKPLNVIQYWGHGSPGTAWLAQMKLPQDMFKRLVKSTDQASLVWFRTCSTFNGKPGYDFSEYLTKLLSCTVAGHTRTIGVLQSGLHTRKPGQAPSCPLDEADVGHPWFVGLGLQWGNNTILCLRASIPEGW